MTGRPVRPVVVLGPTATGKSDLALDLAERFGGEIVNADAMQQYRGMDIGTAKLPVVERRGIAHHLIDVLDVTETATVAAYQEVAVATVERLLADDTTPVIVGGSMMYLQGLLDQWSFPATDPQVRARYTELHDEIGTAALHRRLVDVDPAAAAIILDTDSRRIIRALEVVELTGKPYAASQPPIGAPPRWGSVILALDRPTEQLDERIALRTSRMFTDGLRDEVVELCDRGLREGRTAAQAIGYAQMLAHLDGAYDLSTAEELTFIGTRRYVRRQRSWFRRDPRAHWLDAGDPNLVDAALTIVDAAPTTIDAATGPVHEASGVGRATGLDA